MNRRRVLALVALGLGLVAPAFAGTALVRERSADADLDRSAPARLTARARATAHRPATARAGATAQAGPPDTTVTVSGGPAGRPIPRGFLGVSFEFPAVTAYTGPDPGAVNPVLEQLLRNLAPGQAPVIRIGGNSTDTTWWPVRGLRRPPGISYTVTRRWLATVGRLAHDLTARLILGVDLEAGRPQLAAAEARAFTRWLPRTSLLALEPGNEPTRYSLFPWYRRGRRPVWARPAGYGFPAFNRDFSTAARLFPPGVPLAGPTFAGFSWISLLGRFLAAQPAVGLVTVHRYNLNRCWTAPGQSGYPTVPALLSLYASRKRAAALAGYVRMVHARGLIFRVDEMNSVACGGKFGVSNSFASALWAIDDLFSLAQSGVDGVNLHTFPRAAYGLFSFRRLPGRRWRTWVSPEYYGLLAFAQAAPAGARLLPARTASVGRARSGGALRVWATRAADGTIRLVLLNDDLRRSHIVAVSLPVPTTVARLERLTAPSAGALGGVRLGGQSFSGSTSGRLAPPLEIPLSANRARRFVVALGPASGALLTVRP